MGPESSPRSFRTSGGGGDSTARTEFEKGEEGGAAAPGNMNMGEAAAPLPGDAGRARFEPILRGELFIGLMHSRPYPVVQAQTPRGAANVGPIDEFDD